MSKIKRVKSRVSWKVYVLSLIAFMVGTSQFSIAGLLDKIALSYGVPVATAGQLITVYALSNAIGTPLFMFAATRVRQRSQLLISILIILSGLAIMFLSNSFIAMLFSRAIVGLGAGIAIVSLYGLSAKLAQAGAQGRAMSNVALGASSALVFGVPLGRMISDSYHWKAIFLILSLFSVFAFFFVLKLIPDFAEEKSKANDEVSRLTVLKKPAVALALVMTLFVFIGFSIVDSYITPYLQHSLPRMESYISMVLMMLGFGSIAGSKLGGMLADKLGIKKTLFVAIFGQLLFLLIASYTAKWAVMLLFALLMWDMSCWIFGPTQNFHMLSLAPSVSSIALSLNSTFVQLGIALGAGLGGLALSFWSIEMIPLSAALCAGLALLILGYPVLITYLKGGLIIEERQTNT